MPDSSPTQGSTQGTAAQPAPVSVNGSPNGGAAPMPTQNSAKAPQTDEALTKINRDLEEKIAMDRAKELNVPYVDIGVFPINPDILHMLPEEEARRGLLMPFYKAGKTLKVAIADPQKLETQDVVSKLRAQGFTIQMSLASKNSIESAFRHYTSDQYKLSTEVSNVVKEDELHFEKELENLVKIKDTLVTLPAEEALNLLHVSAIKAGASDIHYQPEEAGCMLRFRIDGVLRNVFQIGRDVYDRVANQLKYKANMKLNITTIPQDGRFRFIVNDRKIDVRVSSLPTEFGEAFVCRILDSGKHFASFEELGFTGYSLEALKRASELAQGMVLVTGPTSSGKTTSLYVLLTQFNKPELKIITLEDPIEYHLGGITQSQVNEKRGYTFAEGLRSILRQDPDVVMIGEIRDLETAAVCAQAALTGHVVLTTLHTNSAVESIARLTTMGLPAFTVAPSLSVVMAQRLVRRLCECAVSRDATEEEKTLFEKTAREVQAAAPALASLSVPTQVKAAKGCENCSNTGYHGQFVVSEVLAADDEVKNAILHNQSASEIFAIARKKGMLTMFEDAIIKVMAGQTTLDEVHRVISA